MNLLNKWIDTLKRIAKVSKDKEAFKQKMLIGRKGYYSSREYFAYEGLIFLKKGVDSYHVDYYLGVYAC